MSYVKVVAGVFFDRDRFLIARRRAGKSQAGKWEFPGGKIEHGETPEESLARELHEEFQIQVSVEEFIASSRYEYDHLHIELLAYRTRLVSGQFSLTDHDAIEWVRLGEVTDYDLAPADIPILEHLMQYVE